MVGDTAHKDSEKFQGFPYRNFKPSYSDMRPVSNQPALLFAIVKTHKFDNYSSINVKNLKLRPFNDKFNTFTYNGAKIVSDYLQALAQKEFVIKDGLLFAEIIKNYILDPDEEYVSYNLQGLFTSIPVSKTINYIVR